MAVVQKRQNQQLAEGYVLITEDKALEYQMEIISEWPKFTEVIANRAGAGILGGTAMLSGLLINNHFRYKLKLGNFGRMSSYLALVAGPAIMTTFIHMTFVQYDVILKRYDCPMCLQTRSGIFQALTGVVYPFVLAPVASFMFATRHFTYKLPSLTENPKDVLKLWMKFTKSASTLGISLLAFNVFVAMLVASRQMSEVENISNKLREIEKKIDAGLIKIQ